MSAEPYSRFDATRFTPPENPTQWIVVSGNPVNGFNFDGPFETAAEAMEWGNDYVEGTNDWWIAKLWRPQRMVQL